MAMVTGRPRMVPNLPSIPALTREKLHRLFDLNRKTGELIWKKPTIPQIKSGTVAGRRHVGSGKILIRIHGRDYGRGALVYQYVFGGSLPMEVRHLNRKMDDDRPENLRPVTAYPDTEVTQEYLRKAFHLNYRTGELFRWIEVQGHLVLETKPAGCLGDSGRWDIHVLGQVIRRNRLVYLYVHGKMPEQISHINGDLTDDRPGNLRPVTVSQRRMGSRGKLGRDLPKGVCQQSSGSKFFYARIKMGGKQHYLGLFETPEEAAATYDGAARNLFGEYARTNNL